MKRNFKFILLLCLFTVMLCTLSACNFDKQQSIKALTKPYIAQYECVEARLGPTDFLEKYEYIYITLLDKNEMEIKFKTKDGDKKSFTGTYTVDPETREFTGEIGILGNNYKESVRIEKGEFTITKNILSMPLIMKFKMK
ncbi:MAG: hypothetical protein K2K80_01265 [Clostridia bacterium]|nr:hypothetical protein [Clostridia bacterium]